MGLSYYDGTNFTNNPKQFRLVIKQMIFLDGSVSINILRYSGTLLGMNITSNAMVEAQWHLFAIFLLGFMLGEDKHVRGRLVWSMSSQNPRLDKHCRNRGVLISLSFNGPRGICLILAHWEVSTLLWIAVVSVKTMIPISFLFAIRDCSFFAPLME